MTKNELSEVVYELKGEFKYVKDTVKSMDEKMDSLPCITHANEIETLRAWKKSCNGINDFKSKEIFKGNISLRNIIVSSLATFFFGIIATIVTLSLTGVFG
jgi:hypothetical protein